MRWLPIVMIVAASLAGCASKGSSEDTAMEAEPSLATAARGWNSDAVLLGLTSLESGGIEIPMDNTTTPPTTAPPTTAPPTTAPPTSAPSLRALLDDGHEVEFNDQAFAAAILGAKDSNVGDGRAPIWAGAYYSPSAGSVALFLRDDMGTQLMGEFPGNASEMMPHLGNFTGAEWKIDSDVAIQAVRAENATLDQAFMNATGPVVLYALDLVDDLAWNIVGMAGNLTFFAQVDAVSGNVTHMTVTTGAEIPPEFFGSVKPSEPLPAPIKETGSNTAAADPMNFVTAPCETPRHQCKEIPFTLARKATITAELTWGIAANDYDFYVITADTREQVLSGASPPTRVGPPERIEGELEPGLYLIQVVPWAVVQDTWTLEASFA